MADITSLVVPGSLTEETPDPRVATYKVGLVGRAAAIFGVDEIVVYEDPGHKRGRHVARILEYQMTAPYLRKRLFPISKELEHVGVLPPLNLPAHTVPAFVNPDQVRFGTMVGNRVDIGLEQAAELELEDELEPPEPGEQFPVKVTAARADRVLVTPYEPDPDEFLGSTVQRAPSLETAVRDRTPVLGTSRKGEELSEAHAQEDLAVVFGTPAKGITEMMDDEPAFPLVNTIPGQQTETVRLEEAVLVSLGRIDALPAGD